MNTCLRRTALGWVAGLLVGIALLAPTLAGATYEKIRVPYPEGRPLSELFYHPDLQLMNDDDGAYVILSRPELTAGLRARGFKVEILVPDLEAYYADRYRDFRDYGVWHTYQETVDEMNLLHTQFPTLTTTPSSVATTGEGRTVWAMKVSDNPSVQESEPEVLFDGVHHAREIMTVEDNLHFIRYLCENHASDPIIKYLVDNRQIWFVPMLNVDGFVYNELTNPNGGGMWRKNRRYDSGTGCYGVDPNRNYPYEWVGSGSSTYPCDETYRGPAPRSEPEIIGFTAFINAHQFVDWESYHSVAGMVLFPWAYTVAHTADDAIYRAVADRMRRDSGYVIGQPPEVLYVVNGGSIDWGYGATTEHQKIFSFTTEIGGSDFWPLPSERDGLIAENLYSNVYFCEIAGAFLELSALAVTGGDGNGRFDPGESCSLVATTFNPGLTMAASGVRVSVTCDDPYVVLTDAQANVGHLAARSSASNTVDPFDLTVDPACPIGRAVTFRVRMEADGGINVVETRSLTIGQLPILYSDTFETTGTEWFTDPSHNAASGAFVRVDPVATGYQPGDDTTPSPGVYAWITGQNPNGEDGVDDVDTGTSATRSPVINLAGIDHAQLDMMYFHGQRDPGDDPADGFKIDVSNNNGSTWTNLVQIGDVNYDPTWRNLKVNLEDLLPLTAQMLFRVQAIDPGGTGYGDIVEGGVDDVYILHAGNTNQPPSAPVLFSPPDGAGGQPANPTLVVTNASDPEGDPLTYGFRVYSDVYLTQVVASVNGVSQGSGTTSWVVSSTLLNGTYYWRAYAADATSRGLYMPAASFTVTGSSSGIATGPSSSASFFAGPNPASGLVHLRYYAPAAPYARLEIYDAAGRQVVTLEGPRWSEGWQDVVWDGRDAAGSSVPAGVYYVRLALPTEARTVRVVQMK